MTTDRQVLISTSYGVIHTRQPAAGVNPLLALALAVDILTPFLIWKGIIPPASRWISHASLILVMVGAVARMLVFNRFPLPTLLIGWMSVTGIGIAVLHGQGVVPTFWGWWLIFQYPLVALFVYLEPRWPSHFPHRFSMSLLAILVFQVFVQIVQYLTGEIPGDNLSGTFGRNGTGSLVIFIVIVFCIALGRWLVRRQLMSLIVVMVLGGVSSVLGEMKLFWVAAVLTSSLAVTIYMLQRGSLHSLIPIGALLAAALIVFGTWYNAVVPYAQKTPLQEYLENPQKLVDYLNEVRKFEYEGRYEYDVGRNAALRYAWTSLSDKPLSLIFGLGLGARGESLTLGTAGTAIIGGKLARSTGTSLLVMMQELGLVGICVLLGFVIITAAKLTKDIRCDPGSDATELRYALVLFTVLWPLWLWYNTAWTLRVPMLLYWAMLGYVMAEARERRLQSNNLTHHQAAPEQA